MNAALRLRVFTYNAFECRPRRHHPPQMEPLAQLLRELDPDIICLHELILSGTAPFELNQAEWLGQNLQRHVFTAITCRGFYRNVGSAVLTRVPLVRPEVFINAQGLRFAMAGLAHHGGQEICLIAGHFARVPRPLPVGILLSWLERTAQVRRCCHWIARQGRPGIIACDLNALPQSPEHRTMLRSLHDTSRGLPADCRNTRPTWGMPIQLDYVFVTPNFRKLDWRVLEFGGSDHSPVCVDLEVA